MRKQKKKAKPNLTWVISEMRNEDGSLTKLGWERIESLTKLVLRRHFQTIPLFYDLLQLGLVRAASVVKEDPENGNYRSLRTYIYTCIRNEISNYLYHTHKRIKESSESLAFCKTKFKHSEIDDKYIDVIFNKLSKKYLIYRDFITDLINVLSDSENFNKDTCFFEELKKRNIELQLNIEDDLLKDSVFKLLYPVEKQILILVINEIKKDLVK